MSNSQLVRLIASYALGEKLESEYKIPFIPEGSMFHSTANPRQKILSLAKSQDFKAALLEDLNIKSLIEYSYSQKDILLFRFSRHLLLNYADDSSAYLQATGRMAQLIELLNSSYLQIQLSVARKIKENLSLRSGKDTLFSDGVLRRAYGCFRGVLSSNGEELNSLKEDMLDIIFSILKFSDNFKSMILKDVRLLDVLFGSYGNNHNQVFRICSILLSMSESLTVCLSLKSFRSMVSRGFHHSVHISFSLRLLALYLSKPMRGSLKLINQFYSLLVHCFPRDSERYFVFHDIENENSPRIQNSFGSEYWVNFESFVKIIFSFFRLELAKLKSAHHARLVNTICLFLGGFLSAVTRKDFPQKMDIPIKLDFLAAFISLSKNRDIFLSIASMLPVRLLFSWAKSVSQLRDRSLLLISSVTGALSIDDLRNLSSYASKSYQVDLYLPYLKSANNYLQYRVEQIVNILSQIVRQSSSGPGFSKMNFDKRLIFLLSHMEVIPKIKMYFMSAMCARPVIINSIRSNREVGSPCVSQLLDFLLGSDSTLKHAAIGVLSKLHEEPEFSSTLSSCDGDKELLSTLVSRVPKSNLINGEARKRLAKLTKAKSTKKEESLASSLLVQIPKSGGGADDSVTAKKYSKKSLPASTSNSLNPKSSVKKNNGKKTTHAQSVFEKYAGDIKKKSTKKANKKWP